MKRSTFRKFLGLYFVMILAFGLVGAAPANVAGHGSSQPAVRIIIDADIGVDDAAAIAYLLEKPTKVEILGITTVAGNTSVENSASNALLLLETAGRTEIPVVVGAAAPLVLPASQQGMFVHGPDGLWFTGWQFPQDISGLSTDAAGFLCDNAGADVTLLALGPLTNLANAVGQCPAQMSLYRILWLGGAKGVLDEGNTPVSVFNPWFDPDAAQIVLDAGLNITMVTTDAARTVTVSTDSIDKLFRRGTALGKLLAPALQQYASLFATSSNMRRHSSLRVALYDPTAAVLLVHPEWASSTQSGLILIQTQDGPARGQTIIALTLPEHLSVLASDAELSAIAVQVFSDPEFDQEAALGEILFRRPDNAQVVMSVNAKKIAADWLLALMR
jgi:purine nucleosidase